MARDLHGFEQGRKRDEQGRPLKIHTPPATTAYARGWDAIFTCEVCGGHKTKGTCMACVDRHFGEVLDGRR